MNHSIFFVILAIALLQSGSWIVRKLFTKEGKIKKNSVIIVESVIITVFLFSYIFYNTPPSEVYKDIKKLNKMQYLYLLITALCVVGALMLIFDLLPKIDISKLGPSISIIRIVLLTIIGFLLFGEKMTMRKVLSLIFMITGVTMLMNSD